MSEIKSCGCGAAMKSLGVKYLSLSDSRLFAGSMAMQTDVEVFICPVCRKLDFYCAEEYPTYESFTGQALYDTYKDAPTEKLEKMLSSSKYTDDCKEVIKAILSARK